MWRTGSDRLEEQGKRGTFGVSLADPECGEGQFPPFVSQTPVTLSLVDQGGFKVSNDLFANILIFLDVV